ncbi:MAG: 5'/3'-nucleotidase SurE [Candidatus Cloacimonetes bacterium]|nr:5'/3'-nucleotidase SurE [Candidatus Cloacimonadota bacterium]
MNVLLVNDDGIGAEGLWALHKAFTQKNHNVYVIAPKSEQSAKSSAITTREALRIENIRENVWAVSGTPVDCVMLGFEHILKEYLKTNNIDLVVSGINAGPNLASDVLYSGTVGAAIEAASFHHKAIAISIDAVKNQKYDEAAKTLMFLIEKGIIDYIGLHEVLNINIPNVNFKDIVGYTVCQAGFSRYQDIVKTGKDGRGRDIIWISGSDPLIEISDYKIDYYVLLERKVAITPLKIDYNNYKKIKSMEKWVKKFT